MAATPQVVSPTPTLREPFLEAPLDLFGQPKAVQFTGEDKPHLVKQPSQAPSHQSLHESRRETASRQSHRSSTGSQHSDDQADGERSGEGEKKEKGDKDPNEVSWDGPDDPANPQNWSNKKKWLVTGLTSLLTLNVTFASSAPSPATQSVMAEFGVSQTAAILVVSCFLCGYVGGPILWGPMSEMIGRRPVLLGTLFAYTLLQLGGALSPTFGGILATRTLAGIFSSSPLVVAGGVVADIWDPVGRGAAMSFFSASVFLGPALSPLVAGYITQSYLGWRWIYWVLLIFAGSMTLLGLIFLPETLAPILLVKKAKKIRKHDPSSKIYHPSERAKTNFKELAHKTVLRPFAMLFQEPILMLITIYVAIVYGLLYACFELVPLIWEQGYGFNLGEAGLIFLAIGVGTALGAIINVLVQRHYRVLVPRWRGTPPPEERLYGAMIAGPFLAIGIFYLFWTGNYTSAIPWWVPMLSLILLGISFSLIFIPFLSYLVDCYAMFAASALAANTIVRSAVGAGLPLVINQWITYQGLQWVGTILGCIAVVLAPSPFLFYKFGHRIRGASKYAPGMDLKIRDEVLEEIRKEKEEGKEKV